MTIPIALIAEHSRATREEIVLLLGDRGLQLRRAQDSVSHTVAFEIAQEWADLHAAAPELLGAAVEMEAVHRNVRRGDFNRALLDTVRNSGARWEALPSLEQKLKARYVEVEVLDYFGHYRESELRLGSLGEEQLQHLRDVVNSGWPLDNVGRTVIKRRVWVALAYATVLYRKGEFDRVIDVLEMCVRAVAASGAPQLLGTRARLAYSRGQVFRQTQRDAEASGQFELAADLARRRFADKTPEVEQTTTSIGSFDQMVTANFEDRRLLAHATVGKSLALGIGWIEFNQGRLASASFLLNAGYVLLRSTGDVVHRAYAMLLIGAVQRARAGNDLAGLSDAIAIMEDGDRVLSEHPMFTLHASYELLLAYYRHPQYHAAANAQLEKLRAAVGQSGAWRSRREARWASQMSVVESRFRRLQLDPDLRRARKAAETAVTAATQAQSPAIMAEAQIASGEVYLAEGDARRAVTLFGRALDNVAGNPKVRSAAHLHMASALFRSGDIHGAYSARRDAALYVPLVEHGFIGQLAKRVDLELRESGAYFVDVPQLVRAAAKTRKAIDKRRMLDELEWQIMSQAKAQGADPMQLLGIGERQFRRRHAELAEMFAVNKGQPKV